ncbi:MAG: DUF1385 domain-containing protein [Dehalococcoidia bacterium]
MSNQFSYGGQAVIEGVMIRGQRFFSLAVRRPSGEITSSCEALSPLYTGRLRRFPLVRGVVVLIETLVLGVKVLNRSASLAMQDEGQGTQEIPRWAMGLTLMVALAIGIALFFLTPLFAARSLDAYIRSDFLSNLLEGVVRLAILVGYIKVIGAMSDIRRVFMYHGAEHMAVHAYEAREPLEVERVRPFPTAHPRCGTAFLLVVMVVAILVFALLGRPPLLWSILSRVLLIPVIAAISYEIIRFSGAHQGNPLVRLVMLPSLWLQGLTTRQPDDSQIEVAVHAMRGAIAADEGQPLAEEAPQPAAESDPD